MLMLSTNMAPLFLKAEGFLCIILEHFVLTHSPMDKVIWDITELYGHLRMTLQVNLCGLILLYIPESKHSGTYFILSLLVLFQC
jgi:hypothetical protein